MDIYNPCVDCKGAAYCDDNCTCAPVEKKLLEIRQSQNIIIQRIRDYVYEVSNNPPEKGKIMRISIDDLGAILKLVNELRV